MKKDHFRYIYVYIYIYIYIYICVCVCVCVCVCMCGCLSVCTCTGLMITHNLRNKIQLTHNLSGIYKTNCIIHTCYFISPTRTHARAHAHTHTHIYIYTYIYIYIYIYVTFHADITTSFPLETSSKCQDTW